MRSKSSSFVVAMILFVPFSAMPAYAQDVLIQVTQSGGGTNIEPSLSADGQRLAFQSNRDLTGQNADLSTEIFLWHGGEGLRQLTSAVNGNSIAPSISDAGDRIAFISDRNLAGGNADGNRELFLWQANAISQLTTTSGGDISVVAISGDASRIAFAATTNPTGANADGNSEIFLWREGVGVTQLTTSIGGTNEKPSINANGLSIAFRSDRDLLGLNADLSAELFLWQQASGFVQLTDSIGRNNNFPSINGAGTRVVFFSDANLTGANPDAEYELFRWSSTGLSQITTNVDAQLGSVMPAFANFVPPNSRSAEVQRVVFRSDDNVAGGNPDANFEVWDWNNRTGVFRQLTAGNGGSVMDVPAIAAGGSHVAFADNGNPLGLNADGNTEVFIFGPAPVLVFRDGFD